MTNTPYHRFPPPTSSAASDSSATTHPPLLPSDVPPNASASAEIQQQSACLDRCHPGSNYLFLLIMLAVLTSLTPFFTSLPSMVTVDAVYTPTFNTSDGHYDVIGTGRAEFGVVVFYKDSFPAVHLNLTDSNATVTTDLTYYSLLGSTAYRCQYNVYSTVSRVDPSGFGLDGVRLALTVPGCTALTVARVALTAYMPLMLVAILFMLGLYAMLYRTDSITTQRQSLMMWRCAAMCQALLVAFGTVQVCAMWTFARSDEFVHPSISAAMYVQPLLVALVALLAVWNLACMYRDAQKVMSATAWLEAVVV